MSAHVWNSFSNEYNLNQIRFQDTILKTLPIYAEKVTWQTAAGLGIIL